MAKAQGSRFTKPGVRHVRAAQLFLFGPPRFKGNWVAACLEAGFKRAPDIENHTSQMALEKARNIGLDVDPVDDRLQALLDGDISWTEASDVARQVMLSIAAGAVRASPGQVAALKEIVARAEGKIGQTKEEERPMGVLILPSLLDMESVPFMGVDPEAGEEIYELHNKQARQQAKSEGWKEIRKNPGGQQMRAEAEKRADE